MIIRELVWSEDRIAHIAKHNISSYEEDEVCFSRSLVLKTKSPGRNPVYHVLGQSASGRYLFCIVIQFPDGNGYPVTARPMTAKEQRRFNQWKNK